ncbi:flagellar hook-length control protein FliK [Sphingorhabdus sp. Alg231-15]|uniref:flagellar hook-length control protein FliK n=1 Tax=Sphingorhabdus sp. Alg231-15 TaxID=1922222 RepID=UPI000D555C06
MIGKIMAEASHSIIGMLSAKPSDMETTTASDAFSALLMPGEDRPRPTLQNDGTEVVEETGIEQFVSQLLGFDDQPRSRSNARDITGTVSTQIVQDAEADKSDLSLETTPSPAPASQIGRFIATQPQVSDLTEKAVLAGSSETGDDAGDSIDSAMMSDRLNQPGISMDQSDLKDSPAPRGRDPLSADTPVSGNETVKANHPLSDVGKIATMPIILVDQPTTSGEKIRTVGNEPKAQIAIDMPRMQLSDKKAAGIKPSLQREPVISAEPVAQDNIKPEISSATNRAEVKPAIALDLSKPLAGNSTATDISPAENSQKAATIIPPLMAKPYSDANRNAPAKVDESTAKNGLTAAIPQAETSERKIVAPLDLRVASTRNVDSKITAQPTEFTAREVTSNMEKPVSIETKTPFADIDNAPASVSLERHSEIPAPVTATPVSAAQTLAGKTVNFDWNAPQFAERFASELSDMKVSGDLKRFEINPRNMGRLEISFVARGTQEIIRIETENDAAREMIVQHSQAIQDMLKAQGRPDLSLRVDIKENMLGSSQSDMMDFAQQENESGHQERSNPSPDRGQMMTSDRPSDPQEPNDNSRYA